MVTAASQDRRVVGTGVLLLAIVIIVAMNHLGDDAVAGRPVADWPVPPPAGSCVDVHGADLSAVSCGQPHDGEVVMASDTRGSGAGDTHTLLTFDTCVPAAARVMRSIYGSGAVTTAGLSDWLIPAPGFDVRLVRSPPERRPGQYGWAACVVMPHVAVKYVGRLAGSDAGSAPSAFGACYDDKGMPASCTEPHAAQAIAVIDQQDPAGASPGPAITTSPLSELISKAEIAEAARAAKARAAAQRRLGSAIATWNAQCRTLAASRIGVADPTYARELIVGVPPSIGVLRRLDASVAAVPAGTGFSMRGTCIVAAVGGAQLTDSILGWGEKQPPVIADR